VGAERLGTQSALLLCAAGIVLPTLAVLGVRDVRELRASPAEDISSARARAAAPSASSGG
jgi:hypothetical protein